MACRRVFGVMDDLSRIAGLLQQQADRR